jgi:hypothetical protein
MTEGLTAKLVLQTLFLRKKKQSKESQPNSNAKANKQDLELNPALGDGGESWKFCWV